MAVAQRSRLEKLLPNKDKAERNHRISSSAFASSKTPVNSPPSERAVNLGAELFDVVLKAIRPGVRESEVAAELEYAARQAGRRRHVVRDHRRQRTAFRTAARCRLAGPSFPSAGFVVLDYGVILDGYCSDQTRTVHVGKALVGSSAQWYKAVLESQLAGIEAVKAGVTAGEVDNACARRSAPRPARPVLHPLHRTWCGARDPRNRRASAATSRTSLAAGMVVTIEPGIYVPGKGGIRIEDMVAVTEERLRRPDAR